MGGCSGKQISKEFIKSGKRQKGQYVLEKKPIGKGGWVKALKGVCKVEDGLVVVAKTFNETILNAEDIQKIKDESDRLVEMDHPNICKYEEWYENKNKKMLHVVYQYVEGK